MITTKLNIKIRKLKSSKESESLNKNSVPSVKKRFNISLTAKKITSLPKSSYYKTYLLVSYKLQGIFQLNRTIPNLLKT